ncbi:MAG TPA: lytic transglycosylase domain-containing protein [Thermoanaerobaculia bacterium]|nr:lytic transglycosylase domain-containing protein [Thermoanaerobaculia bacterium]
MRRRWLVITITILVAVGLTAIGIYFFVPLPIPHRETRARAKPEAPPDLAKLRDTYTAGLDALQRGDGHDAVKHFSSFRFGSRAVEQYRLYLLANGYQVAGDKKSARITLARLWAVAPTLVYWEDAAFNLGALYRSVADWDHSADVYGGIAVRSETPSITATARWNTIEDRFVRGDIDAVLYAARNIGIKSPRAAQSGDALDIVRSLSLLPKDGAIKLSPSERLERGVCLLRDGDPQNAFDELTALEPSTPASLRDPVELNRGLALYQLHRYEDANKVLEPLASHAFKIAIPAIYHASKGYRALASSIDPYTYKTVMQRKQVGTTKVRKGKGKKAKVITRPKFAKVKTQVKLIDLAKKAKQEEYDRLSIERLKDLLSLPVAKPVRIEVLNTLIGLAEQKNQDEYEQDLVGKLVALDRLADPGLQHFWDKAWAAYARGDLAGAKKLFRFIADTYQAVGIKRQGEYWYARTIERAGDKEAAMAIYRNLASAPYDDLYALFAKSHGVTGHQQTTNPLTMNRPDWGQLAEKMMPPELRLAYELTALSDMKNARMEIQKNVNKTNQPYADALMSDLYHANGDSQLMFLTIRRAFPQLATVEQDAVPPYFLRMYYPTKYEDEIRKYSEKNGVDPYVITGLIHQESYFNPRAKSRVGATGLMQLMPATGKELAQQLHSSGDLQNPEVNIRLGTFHFRHLMDLFGGNAQLAVASYNAGQGNVLNWRRGAPHKPMDEFLESMPFAETRTYVKRVTILSATYRRINQ